jgi:tetratricopeptide (TPR) repeat protein
MMPPAPLISALTVALLLPGLSFLPGVASGMNAGTTPGMTPASPTDDPRFHQAEDHFQAGETRQALEVVEAVVRETDAVLRPAPGSPERTLRYGALWRGASYAVALGVERDAGPVTGSPEPSSHWYGVAERRATQAMELDPEGVEGRYWKIAVLGRRAFQASPREASELSDRMLALGRGILADEPDHAPTLNALGRLDLEIMSTSGVTRFFGRALTGGEALGAASWEGARTRLERAVALDPERAMYLLDMGRYHKARGNRSDARAFLERAVAAAGTHPPDRIFAREARALLREVGG